MFRIGIFKLTHVWLHVLRLTIIMIFTNKCGAHRENNKYLSYINEIKIISDLPFSAVSAPSRQYSPSSVSSKSPSKCKWKWKLNFNLNMCKISFLFQILPSEIESLGSGWSVWHIVMAWYMASRSPRSSGINLTSDISLSDSSSSESWLSKASS